CPRGCVPPGSAEQLRVDARSRRTRNDLLAILIGRGNGQVHVVLPAFVAQRCHRRFRIERVTRPDLVGEAHAELRQPSVTHVIREHLAGQPHGQHAVREYARVAGDLRRVDLIRVQRVVIARYARVLHDLGARQVLRHTLAVGVADLERRRLQCHCDNSSQPWSTGRSVVTPTPRAVTTSSPFWSRYSVTRSRKVSLPARLLCFSQVLPGLVSAVSTSPGRSGRWYSKCCSACRPPDEAGL